MKKLATLLNIILCFELVLMPLDMSIFSIKEAKAESCAQGMKWDANLGRCLTDVETVKIMQATASCEAQDVECYKKNAQAAFDKDEAEGKVNKAKKNNKFISTVGNAAAIAAALYYGVMWFKARSSIGTCAAVSYGLIVGGGATAAIGEIYANMKHKKNLKKIEGEWKNIVNTNYDGKDKDSQRAHASAAQSEAFEMLAKAEDSLADNAKTKNKIYTAAALMFSGAAIAAGLEHWQPNGWCAASTNKPSKEIMYASNEYELFPSLSAEDDFKEYLNYNSKKNYLTTNVVKNEFESIYTIFNSNLTSPISPSIADYELSSQFLPFNEEAKLTIKDALVTILLNVSPLPFAHADSSMSGTGAGAIGGGVAAVKGIGAGAAATGAAATGAAATSAAATGAAATGAAATSAAATGAAATGAAATGAAATGAAATGAAATGAAATGAAATGAAATGAAATGAAATGAAATGAAATGAAATGAAATGAAATGAAATGAAATGAAATGAAATGAAATGTAATGAAATGTAATGTAATGAAATGTAATGTAATGAAATGTAATGTAASGTAASGTAASGTAASGTAASGTAATGAGGEAATGAGFNLTSPMARMVVAGVFAGWSLIMANHAKSQSEASKNRAEHLRKMKAEFAGASATINMCTPEDRSNTAKPECYCYTSEGQRNPNRGNSQICQNLWSGGLASAKGYKDSSNAFTGCINNKNEHDETCACKKSSKGCLSVSTQGINGISTGALSLLKSATTPLNEIASGNFAEATANDAANLNAAMRNIKAVESMLESPEFKKHEDKIRKGFQTVENQAQKGARSMPYSPLANNFSGDVGQAVANLEKDLSVRDPSFKPSTAKGPAVASPSNTPKKNGFDFNFTVDDPATDQAAINQQVSDVLKQEFDFAQNDINQSQANLFELLSNRYQRSGLRRLFDDEGRIPADAPAASDISE